MKTKKRFTGMLVGMGAAALLFIGCQELFSSGGNGESAPQEMALRLTVTSTDPCAQLQSQILAARQAGTEMPEVEDQLVRQCIDELPPLDKGLIPPDRVPDGKTRCRWILVQIDGGRHELVAKFRYYCPDDCDRMSRDDTAAHLRYCRDPISDCAEMRKKLATLDPHSEDYAHLLRQIEERCGIDIRPIEDTCLALRKKLSTLDPNTEEYARLKKQYAEHCVDPVVLTCDQLREKLATLPPDSEDAARLRALIAEKCADPVLTCEQMKAKLGTLDPASAEYAELQALIARKCADPAPTCEEMRAKLATLDPNSEDYARLKAQITEHCPVR